MRAPERLNVLLSRARNGMIIFGNMETFLDSRHASACWVPFFELMKEKGYLQDGLVVHCEQHPSRKSVLSSPREFDLHCPEGGCSEPCGVQLPCGAHNCQRQCHRLADHSNITCSQIVQKKCETQHSYEVACDDGDPVCPICFREEEERKRQAARDLRIEQDRLSRQILYREKLQDIENKQNLNDNLGGSKKPASKNRPDGSRQNPRKARSQQPPGIDLASVRHEWERQKREELASDDAVDSLMEMIGHENVKTSFLNMKATVDTAILRGSFAGKDMSGFSFIGNPGTGTCPFLSLGSFINDSPQERQRLLGWLRNFSPTLASSLVPALRRLPLRGFSAAA